ncbi:protoporphyrinogen oxidase [Beutenbergia cavernae DSM 12333]|uniref:Protoporphyrinogen oxidase n=1 Tax=Beutenbergia cavernae (strain ATCC BAA-8 / DSM 12333 / CCUG 43141 / JCM 11478 / NBRC 16432 / NCIMB 13614 / HKI 0122) TaxID=471853 RepID=C5C5B2_BEUC1|nr:FAD-dependent oxidoreductase [Beutenbergia cavernae]ACQ82252.1 protoporphyrinogen oxidase [Beutenbergia cavernae DSM 12333]
MADDGAPRGAVPGAGRGAGPGAGPGAERRADAVVVGGGIGGLVAARELTRAGLTTLVLEASDAVGGPLRAVTIDGPGGAALRLDAGAESFATRTDAVAALAAELGLATADPAAGGAWAWAGGRAFPLPAPALLGIPGRPWSAAVRAALGAGGQVRAALDAALPRRVGAREQTLAGLVRRRMGRRVVDRLVGPVAGGVHAADPRDLAVDAVAPGLRAALRRTGSLAGAVRALRSGAAPGAAVRGIVGGMHLLPTALAAQAGEVRLRAPVTAIERADDGWEVVVAGGRVRTPRVVLATDAATAAALLAPHTRLDDGDVSAVAPDRAADIALVTLVLRTDELAAAPRGTGVLVAADGPEHGVRAKALTHVDAKWAWVRDLVGPGHAVVRLSFGRPGERLEPPAGAAFEPWLVERATSDAATLLGVGLAPADVVASAVTRWPGALPPPTPAARAARERVLTAASGLPGVGVTGAWVAGTGLAATVPHAASCAVALVPEIPTEETTQNR